MTELVKIKQVCSAGRFNFLAKIKLLSTRRVAKNDTLYGKGVFEDMSGSIPFTVFGERLLKQLEKAWIKELPVRIDIAKCGEDSYTKTWAVVLNHASIISYVIGKKPKWFKDIQIPKIPVIKHVSELTEALDDKFIELSGVCHDVQVNEDMGYLATTYNLKTAAAHHLRVLHWGGKPLLMQGLEYQLSYVKYRHDMNMVQVTQYSRMIDEYAKAADSDSD